MVKYWWINSPHKDYTVKVYTNIKGMTVKDILGNTN
jgi:hypothetical protein